jgi:hypothetical protein
MNADEQEAWEYLAATRGGMLDGEPVTHINSCGKYVYAFTKTGTYQLKMTFPWRLKRWLKRLFGSDRRA